MPESRNDNSAPEKRAHNSGKEKKQPSLVGLGVDLARCQQLTDQHSAAFPLLERILQQRKLLRESYEQISLSDKPELVQTHAAEWLLDNFYLVEETFQQIDEDFPKSFYQRLPLLDNTELKSYPRVFGIAWSLVHQVSFNPSYDQIKSFLNAYQKVQVLKIGEVWAVPVMLRIAILEILAQEMSEITGIHLPEFVIQMELSGGERQQSAIVASCIQGLSTLKIIDWKRLFEDVSRVERVLKQDPDQVYVAMDFETRDQYRKAVEQLSDRSGIPEDKVAEQAIQLAQAAHARHKDTPDPTLRIQKHVGYYLVERGLPRLREEIDYQPGLNERFGSWVRQHAFPLYVSSIGTATVILIALLLVYLASIQASLLQLAVALFLSILPASTIAVSLVNTIITLMVSPRPPLARLDFSKGVPEDCRTLVVIPALLTNSQGVDALLRQLELYYLGNGAEQIFFALLTDLEDAAQQRLPEDEGLVEQVIAGINSLNERYPKELGSNFYLFHRDRKWNPVEEVWMGWERKRGKLSELNHFLRGDQANHFSQVIGETRILEGSKYVITLDEDTFLPNNAARELIGIMAHPFNCPQFDPQSDQVVAGYTFLQPRVEVKPESAQRTRFTRIYVGEGGIDLYSQTVSNVYQDLFGEGSYMGKGIYDVDAYLRTLEGKIPENAVLSHDLLEGLYGRAGLVTDVVLYESFPLYYLAYTQRIHRWMRGDWQLLSWLLPFTRRKKLSREENTLSALDIWKLADNLRRSLTFPGVLAFLVLGWLLSPVSAVLWTVAGLMPLAVPVFSGMIPVIWFSFSSDTLVTGWLSMRRDLALWLLNIVFLPYQSLLALDAIGATLVRLFITHKHLLQWTTAAHTIQVMDKEFKVEISWGRMRSAVIFALVVAAVVGMLQPTNLLLIAPILFMWLISPQIAYWISQHITHDKEEITSNERRELRRLARRTWHFFEQFVGPEDNWLPPDHFQEDPRGTVAHRTSPTNIGLGLLSDLSAYDLGYIGVWELSVRLQNTFNALHSLEKYNGHLLNWYQTQNLKPLLPRYVSTVDSGNFAGSLLALRQACQEVCHAPVFRAERWQGLLDTLDLLNITLVSTEMPSQTKKLLSLLDEIKQDIQRSVEQPGKWLATLKEIAEKKWTKLDQQMRELISSNSMHLESEELHSLRVWTERTHQHIVSMLRTMDRLLPWLDEMEDAPWKDDNFTGIAQISTWESLLEVFPVSATLVEISSVCEKGLDTLREFQDSLARGDKSGSAQVIEEWCNQFSERLLATQQQVQDLLGSFHELQVQSEEFFEAMDFSFLFNETRNIFRIGYNVDTGRLDGNHYDLLASEARLASFLAIAKGDVPQKHWLYLGRPLTKTGEGLALLSWSGSMFEYLMPHLLMKQYPQTLLQLTCKTIVEKQIDYAKSQHVPWGISESGYYHFDASRNYQYRAFGVPGLGLKRGLDVDLVITPYASILALDVDSKGVLDNLSRLADLNMLDRYGLYEAIDYTKSRLPLNRDRAPVQSFMAHHQGMILLSLTNFLEGGSIRRRFHADPRIETFELLLQEQIPPQPHFQLVEEKEISRLKRREPSMTEGSWMPKTNLGFPSVHFLSNGRMGTLITHHGSGFIQYMPGTARQEEPVMLTRWRPDTTLDRWGVWIYLQDIDNGDKWSAGVQPTGVHPETANIEYFPHQAIFERRDKDVSTQTSVTVSPEDDVEIRRVSLVNHRNDIRHLRVTSYGEVVLADKNSDTRHQAFNKLFVEAEYHPNLSAILFKRRPRSEDESPLYLIHMLAARNKPNASPRFECDRAEFLGRGRTTRDPQIINDPEKRLTETAGITLDPIMALSIDLELAARERADIAYITAAADSRKKALALARDYQTWSRIERAFESAESTNGKELSALDLSVDDLEVIQQLLSVLYYPHPALRADAQTLASNEKGQSGLWSFAISGDYPLVLVRVSQTEDADLVKVLLKAHRYWRRRDIKIDLVIFIQGEVSYSQDLQGQLRQLVTQMDSDNWINRRGGIFILQAGQMDSKTVTLLETVAYAVLDGDKGSLAEQIRSIPKKPAQLPEFNPMGEPLPQDQTPALPRPEDLLFDNGYGGFSPESKEYVVYLEPGRWTPAPWINVIAAPEFGFIVSESGMGSTWAVNSGENRLTPWRNDPVSDTPAEALYLRNEDTGEIWSPTPLPAGAAAPYLIRHAPGYSVFEHNSHGLEHSLRLSADSNDPVKVAKLTLRNTLDRVQQFTVTYYTEWVLGPDREYMAPYIIPEFVAQENALLARNAYNQEFLGRCAFLSANLDVHGCTTDRAEFLGENGSYSHPDGLTRVGLSGSVEPGQDPCAAFQVLVWLDPGETKDVIFLLGEGKDRQQAIQLIEKYRQAETVEQSWQRVQHTWADVLETVQVETPDPAIDLLLNRWLLYQAVSCRLWGRSALYQSSGAFGFRDQLQDVTALVNSKPELTRQHILRAARHQFTEGDVLHWWHPPSGRGLRTRCSDNMLWLPYVTANYIDSTGDESILQESVPYLSADPLKEDEHERYGSFEHAGEQGTLLDHCLRAIDFGTTQGIHGLPLMGSHDWNDGMNRVGNKGKGESVWLGWFLYATLVDFADICERAEKPEKAKEYRLQADDLRQSIEDSAWDGAWYLRAYFDDGTPLGSEQNKECKIDSLAQSWAIISGAGDPKRARQAMQSVDELLVDREDGLIKLFTPPFDKSDLEPGYVKGYPPGIRENGGQYTHAAIWAVWAYATMEHSSQAAELFQMLNPIYHSNSLEKAERYQVEPYVVAADIYSVEPHIGNGGWTWYTGSGGWLYRLGLERILGFNRHADRLEIDPRIPESWSGYTIHYRYGASRYRIRVDNPEGVRQGVKEIRLDGKKQSNTVIELLDDGEDHQVVIQLG